MYLARYPPNRAIAAAQVSRYARMTARSSSGSSWVERAVDPTRSQNITVSCRRSASAVLGTKARGAEGSTGSAERSVGAGVAGCSLSAVPHSAQNLAWGKLSNRQLGQAFLKAPPHSIQNLAPSGFSNLQLAQRML